MSEEQLSPTIEPQSALEIAPGVHVIPDRGIPLLPNIGLIEGSEAVLVVDTGLGPANGAIVYDWARRVAGERKILLALTHFHPEHAFGAQAFRGRAEIIVNRLQAEEFADKAAGYLEMFQGFGPVVVEALAGTELVPADRVYDGTLTLDLGGRQVMLENIGPAHCRGDQIVWLPEEKIVFTGDLAEAGMFPIFPWFPGEDTDLDAEAWAAALRHLSAREPAIVVPGHGALSGAELLDGIVDYMERMRAAVIEAGEEFDADAIAARFIASHPDWQGQEWPAFAARHYHDVMRG